MRGLLFLQESLSSGSAKGLFFSEKIKKFGEPDLSSVCFQEAMGMGRYF